jgi:hypothetical protein
MTFRPKAFLRSFVAAFVLPGALIAGVPEEQTLSCPFGNETVTFTVSSSCTIYQEERAMSFRPLTSCDFAEPLPQCAKSKLPLYKDFSRAEVKVIREFAKTEEYAKAAAISRFYLSYVIETKLNPEIGEEHYFLLMEGYWYDSARTFGNAEFFKAFAAAANQRIKVTTGVNQAHVMAVASYAALKMGKMAKAGELIRAVRRTPGADPVMLDYVTAVERCISRPNADKCQPESTAVYGYDALSQ